MLLLFDKSSKASFKRDVRHPPKKFLRIPVYAIVFSLDVHIDVSTTTRKECVISEAHEKRLMAEMALAHVRKMWGNLSIDPRGR